LCPARFAIFQALYDRNQWQDIARRDVW
jgi:hypothetical protein